MLHNSAELKPFTNKGLKQNFMCFLEMNVTASALILMSSMISQMFKERNLIQPDDYLLIFCGAPVHTVGGEGGG